MKTDHQLAMLAYAEKDGKLVHDLRIRCPGDQPGLMGGGETGRWCLFDYPESEEGWVCPCRGKNGSYIPNSDLMAPIAAITKRWPELRIDWDNAYVTPVEALYGVRIVSEVGYDGETEGWEGLDADLYTALVDILFQATLTLKPDNWVECNHCGGSQKRLGYICPKLTGDCPCVYECYLCHATGLTLKETL